MDPQTKPCLRHLHGFWCREFEALRDALVPCGKDLSRAEKHHSLEIIDNFLATQRFCIRFQLKCFLLLVTLRAILRGGRPFSLLHVAKRKIVMSSLFDSNFKIFRQGFWGINTLAKMSVYGQKAIYPLIGYQMKEMPS